MSPGPALREEAHGDDTRLVICVPIGEVAYIGTQQQAPVGPSTAGPTSVLPVICSQIEIN